MMRGIISFSLDHSGCKKSWQPEGTFNANSSAQSKSLLLKITTFNSFALPAKEGSGALNFFGDKQTQSHSPDRGYAPEDSRWVFNPAFFNSAVRPERSYIVGSPPVTTAISPPLAFARRAISLTSTAGCMVASQESFTSHQT